VKGLYTFITNLFTSEIKIRGLPEHSFMREYFHSFDNEIYPLILPKACHGMLFEEVHLAISLQDWITPPLSVITGFFFLFFWWVHCNLLCATLDSLMRFIYNFQNRISHMCAEICIVIFTQVVEFVFTTFNVVLFALDVALLHERNPAHRQVQITANPLVIWN
jgi:hypothetical protein